MRHVPHVLVPAPWEGDECPVPAATRRHLETVLRLASGADVTYTDGRGTVGEGVWHGSAIARGNERTVAPVVPVVTMAVAPPRSRDRQRFVVEKLQELAIQRLVWLSTGHGQVRPPGADKSTAWARAALEQSRGAHLMQIDVASLESLDADGVVWADITGDPVRSVAGGEGPFTVAIGPEGGWSGDERARFVRRVALASTILRTETAAVVAAAAFR
jgi:RsmE family RNA methyltransferase